jgi:hypothetical protein
MTTYELETELARLEIAWRPDGLSITVEGERVAVEEHEGYAKVEIGFGLPPEDVPGAD